jgi:hypothetical protein
MLSETHLGACAGHGVPSVPALNAPDAAVVVSALESDPMVNPFDDEAASRPILRACEEITSSCYGVSLGSRL